MLDTYKTVNKFKRLYNLVSYFKGYVEFKNFDYGPVFHPWFNEVEGIRLRAGVERILTQWSLATSSLYRVWFDNKFNMAFRENGWSIRKPNHYFEETGVTLSK
jgi:hypothetical protein